MFNVTNYSFSTLFLLTVLINGLLVVTSYTFIDEPLFEVELWIILITSFLLYFFKITLGYLFLFIFTLLLSDKTNLENISFSLLFKAFIFSDIVNVVGDIAHALILYLDGENSGNLTYMYSSYPLSLGIFFESNLLAAGILKDINLFQLLSVTMLFYVLLQTFNLAKSKAFKIALYTSVSSLFIINVIWLFFVITLENEFIKVG